MAETKDAKGEKDAKVEASSVFDVKDTQTDFSITGVRYPDQDIPEKDKTPEWFLDNLRYIGSFYNNAARNVAVFTGAGPEMSDYYTNGGSGGGRNGVASPVTQMLRYMLYYLGNQPNLNYNHLTQDLSTTNLQSTWVKGQKITALVDFMKGNMLKALGNVHFSARPISEKAVSEKTRVFETLMMKYDMKDFFNDMANKGVNFNPMGAPDFQFPEEVEKWMEYSFKEFGAETASNMATGIWYDNYCSAKFLQGFLHTAVAGLTGIEHYIDNGKYYNKIVMPYNLIIDNRVDDDYNRYARFVGKLEQMTPTEIFKRYPALDGEQRKTITEIARNDKLQGSYNTWANIKWWNFVSGRQDASISVATVYWIGPHNLGYVKNKNRYGDQRIVNTPNGNGEYVIDDVYKATLIGNKYLVDFGYCNNIVENQQNKARPELPIKVFMPNMVLGESRSVVSRLHNLQDDADMYAFKIKEMVANAKGKRYIIRGEKLGNGVTPQSIIQDFSSMGIHVTTTSGEQLQADDGQRMVEVVDMTLDPNVQAILGLKQQAERDMEEIVNVSKIALGQQQTYIGMGTQQASIGQSTLGLAYIYEGFMDFVQMNIQYGVNMEKLLWTMDETMQAAVTVGDRGRQYLKITKDYKFEDFLIYLHVRDIIDETQKQGLITIAQALAQNGLIEFLDFIQIQKAQTYTELENAIEYSLKKKKREVEKQQQLQAYLAQVEQAKMLQAQKDQEMMRQVGANQRKEMDAESKMAAQGMKMAESQGQPQ